MRFIRYLSILALALGALATSPLASARAKYQGFCVTAAGTRSLGCTVRVLLTGTLTNATLYSNNAGASQGNPFTADASTGLFQFYADNGKYDITFSGGAPSITTPYTFSTILLLDNTTTNQPVTFAGSLIPTISANDDLGSTASRWRDIFASTLNLTGNATISGSLLPATDALPLGSTTKSWNLFANNITWNANTAFTGSLRHFNTGARTYTFPDSTGSVPLLNLAQNWAAAQTFLSGAVLSGSTFDTLTSTTALPATAGDIRLAASDSIQFRNAANTNNISALSVDLSTGNLAVGNPTGAVVEFGGASGITVSGSTLLGGVDQVFSISARSTVGPAGKDVQISASNAVSGNSNGGIIYLVPGSKTGSGLPGSVIIQNGISNSNGTGFKHLRQTTGSIAGGTRVEVTVSWPGSFGDTNYTVICSVNDSVSGATAQGLILERTRQITASLTSVVVSNPTGGALTGTVSCIAVHDGA